MVQPDVALPVGTTKATAGEPPARNRVLRALWAVKGLAWARLRGVPGFKFAGEHYRFLFRRYNATWRNERQVEVPVIRRIARNFAPESTLEVGNVLSHYGPVRHRVIDKYELAAGLENEDFLNHKSSGGYQLVVSVSTFEHIGWDEDPRDANLFLRAVDHARSLLRPGGLLAFTVPLGYHPEVDGFVANPPPGFHVLYLARYGPQPGQWRQEDSCRGATHPYNPRGHANAIAVVRYVKPGLLSPLG